MFLVKKMATTNFQKGIDELLNRLDEEETDISKICDVNHNVLMAMLDRYYQQQKKWQNFK